MDFNPRAPCGARLDKIILVAGLLNFNPRAPCGARLTTTGNPAAKDSEFQPTRPLRGATKTNQNKVAKSTISTHAPLAGRDDHESFYQNPWFEFQPTRPLRGATLFDAVKGVRELFQPTRPLRGATFPNISSNLNQSDFNPRAPCGARQQKCTNHYAHFCDNRQISDAFAQNAACQGILLLFDAGKPCGFWVRTAQVVSARLCFAL